MGRHRRWAWLPAVPLAAYVLAGCSLYGIQRSLAFHPWQGVPEQAEAAGMAPVKVTAADGVTVVHWYAPAQPGHATVVLFHGNGGTVTALASWATAFRARGFGVVLADYRGYSGNPGVPSEEGLTPMHAPSSIGSPRKASASDGPCCSAGRLAPASRCRWRSSAIPRRWWCSRPTPRSSMSARAATRSSR